MKHYLSLNGAIIPPKRQTGGDGGSLVGGATRAVRSIMSWIGGVYPIIAGAGVTLVLMVGIAF